MDFIFTDKMQREALEANGFHALWHPDNYVKDGHPNPDWNGMSIERAFRILLKEKNLVD
jgi:hypothetical protein